MHVCAAFVSVCLDACIECCGVFHIHGYICMHFFHQLPMKFVFEMVVVVSFVCVLFLDICSDLLIIVIK